MADTVTTTYVQQRRSKGWRKPDGAVSLTRGRNGDTSRGVHRFGNPFEPGGFIPDNLGGGRVRDAAHAVELHRTWLRGRPLLVIEAREKFRGQTLMCWCAPGQPCHVQDNWIPIIEGEDP